MAYPYLYTVIISFLLPYWDESSGKQGYYDYKWKTKQKKGFPNRCPLKVLLIFSF
jgi:hypothetical protein